MNACYSWMLATEIAWLRPTWILFAALGAVVVLVGGALARRRAARARAAFAPQRLAAFLREADSSRRGVRVACAGLALALLGVAAAGPVFGVRERRVIARGLDLVVCLDTSRSMLARDLKPSRFDRAKREIHDLLNAAGGDRIALIAFSGDARDVAPLTRDRRVLGDLVDRVDLADNRLGGTDLGVALERALELFDGRSGAHEAIVLLTDGEDLSGRGAEVAAQAAERGIAVFVVGIGTAAGGKLPISSGEGESFLVGPDGEEVVSRLEGESLERLADSAGGFYRSTEQSPRPLFELYDKRISRLDRRNLEGGLERVPLERFQWPLAAALLLILFELASSDRRRPARSQR